MGKRRNHDADLKARVALEAVTGERGMSELAAEYGVHQTMIHHWKKALLDGAADIFERGGRMPVAEMDEKTLRSQPARIGNLAVVNVFVTQAQAVDRQVRHGMIQRGHPALLIGGQCGLPSISHPSCYHEPVGEMEQNLGLMRVIDPQFTSFAWTDRLKRVGTRISMDGKGRGTDNVFIERLWRSRKYECICLHARDTGSQTMSAIETDQQAKAVA